MSTATDLKSRIDADMKAAMRAREKVRLGALRLLLAAIKQKEVDERTTLDDAQVLAIVEKLSKQRRDSIEQFEKAGRTELAEQERAELAVLDTYRPAQADDAQIQAVIEDAVAETGAAGMADMGKVMAIVKTAGRTGRSGCRLCQGAGAPVRLRRDAPRWFDPAILHPGAADPRRCRRRGRQGRQAAQGGSQLPGAVSFPQ